MKRIQAVVRGQVQGVSFRFYTRSEATHLGLTGWARNVPDGTVEAMAEGPETDLQQFIAFLHRGSPAANVSRVDVTWGEAANEFTGFEIRWL